MTDMISRAYVLAEYDKQHQGPPGGARKIIAEAPAVDAVPVVHAQWIHHEGGFSDHFECTACGMAIVLTGKWNYCPNCGARMDGERRDGE